MIIVFIGTIIYQVRKNKEKIAALSGRQMVGAAVAFILTVFVAFVSIYYGGNWLVSFLSNGILKTAIQFLIIIFVISLCTSLLNKMLKRITNGIIDRG